MPSAAAPRMREFLLTVRVDNCLNDTSGCNPQSKEDECCDEEDQE